MQNALIVQNLNEDKTTLSNVVQTNAMRDNNF